MDKIIVLAAGKIVEEGKYQELLAGAGPFSRMAKQQGLAPLRPAVPAPRHVAAGI